MSGPNKNRGHGISDVEKQERAEEKNRNREEDLNHRAIGVLTSAINRIADQLTTNENEQNANESKRRFREWLTIGLIVGTVFFAAVGDWIFYRTMVNDGRAWVSVDKISDKFVDPYMMLKVHIINVGKSPATGIKIWKPNISFVSIGPNSEEALAAPWPQSDMCSTKEAANPGIEILPGDSQGMTGEVGISPAPGLANGIRGVMNGTKGLLIVGCVVYRTFGETHHEQYCYIERQSGPDKTIPAIPCTEGTYAD